MCNKVFLYLHAGLACVATNTLGHASVLAGSIGARADYLFPPGNVDALVEILRRLTAPEVLMRAQNAAWLAGSTRYSWDVECEAFLRAVSDALAGRLVPARTLAGEPARASAQQVA